MFWQPKEKVNTSSVPDRAVPNAQETLRMLAKYDKKGEANEHTSRQRNTQER